MCVYEAGLISWKTGFKKIIAREPRPQQAGVAASRPWNRLLAVLDGPTPGPQEHCGLKPHYAEGGLCTRGFGITGPAERESTFYHGSPDGAHAYYSLQDSLEPYPGAALSMKAKPVFLLLARRSREALINILLPAEAFLL